MKVTTTKDNLTEVMKSIKSLVNRDVLVGIPGSNADRKEGDPVSNAVLGYIHTNGGTIQIPERTVTLYRKVGNDGELANGGRFVKSRKANFATTHIIPAHTVTLPPRPFLEPGIINAQDDIANSMKKAAEAALAGKPSEIENAMEAAGTKAQKAAQAVLNSGDELTPLAPSTLASRRSRGRTGDKPLVDTGQLRNSITYVLRTK
ncbi:hypothetical protein [Chromobacterium violaceum]|uniref:hypothetical protein n=1 Tax=Chromobacterium violaceum TaxID=536 RepID=UPI0005BC0E5E|nr:hypothetical protein [Chromobacterium violaceum]